MNAARRIAKVTPLMAVASIFLASCGPSAVEPERAHQGDNVSKEASCPPIDVAYLRMSTADYEPRSPEALFESANTVVAATLSSIEPGYTVRIEEGYLQPYVIAHFTVDETFKDPEPSLIHRGSVYVRLDQGSIDTETDQPSFGIDEFRTALPTGMQTVLYLSDARSDRFGPEPPPIDAVPEQATVTGAGHQGFLIDDCGELIGGRDDLSQSWQGFKTLEELRMHLRAQG